MKPVSRRDLLKTSLLAPALQWRQTQWARLALRSKSPGMPQPLCSKRYA